MIAMPLPGTSTGIALLPMPMVPTLLMVVTGECAAALWELGGREHAGDLPPEVREVFQRQAKAVDRVRVYRVERRRV
jgi:hypothetical protein